MQKWFTKLFQRQKCAICHHKAIDPRIYYNQQGEKIAVCMKCIPYAERRAFRKQ